MFSDHRMDSLNIDKLVVPELASQYEDVSKSGAVFTHREKSLIELKDLLQLFEIENIDFEQVTWTIQQTAKLLAVLLQFTEESEWSTEEHVLVSDALIGLICKRNNFTNLQTIMSHKSDEDASLISKIPCLSFKFHLDRVKKDNFERNPAACFACEQIIMATQGRKVESCLSFFLPFTLNYVDHYLQANKIKGMNLLTHTLKNITSSELLFTGLGDVFYETLHRLLYSNEVEILEALFLCFFLLLSKTCRNPSFSETYLKWTKYDDLCTLILQHMRYESAARKIMVFIDAVLTALAVMKLSVSKHVKLILQVLTESCDGTSLVCAELALKIVELLDQLSFILGGKLDPVSCEGISKCLFQLILDFQDNMEVTGKCSEALKDLSSRNLHVREALKDLKRDNLIELENLNPQLTKILLQMDNL